MKTKTVTAGIFLLAVLTAGAYPMERDGVSFPDRITANGVNLTLNGLGTREATIFKVNVYVAALYLETPGRDGETIARAEETKRLILHFVRKVGESDITSAWREGLEKNAGEELAAYEERLETLNSWMSPMADGDRMTFTYIPGAGLEVSVKGEVKGIIEGSDFAGVFFAIWLGGSPPNRSLRDGLLGR
jgi:hypothetical protein